MKSDTVHAKTCIWCWIRLALVFGWKMHSKQDVFTMSNGMFATAIKGRFQFCRIFQLNAKFFKFSHKTFLTLLLKEAKHKTLKLSLNFHGIYSKMSIPFVECQNFEKFCETDEKYCDHFLRFHWHSSSCK